MARDRDGSRKQIDPEPAASAPVEPVARGSVRRGKSGASRRNVMAQQRDLYGLLVSASPAPGGSRYLSFECTDGRWFNHAIEHGLPADYRVDRLRVVLRGRDYHTAWENSVGERVVLRHAFDAYRTYVLESNPAPQLALYEVLLEEDDGRVQGAESSDWLKIGNWYGLNIRAPLGRGRGGADSGLLSEEDQGTETLGPWEVWPLAKLHCLPLEAKSLKRRWDEPHGAGRTRFYSQAILQALHFARGGE